VDLLIGSSEGVFVVGPAGQPRPAEGLASQSIRALRQVAGGVLAGGDGGVHRSQDGGRSWRPAGVEGKTVWEIAVAPSDARQVYVGVQPAGLYRSRDGGETWAEVESLVRFPTAYRWGLPNSDLGARARTIVVDRTDPAHYWVGLEVGGVLTTDDDGATWTCDVPLRNPDIHVMVQDPSHAGVLYATTGFGRVYQPEPRSERVAGLIGTTDGGQSWRYLWEGVQPTYTRPICIDPRPPHALTVACAPGAFSSYTDPGGAQAMLYQSAGGEPWRSLGDAAHSPSAANLLAVAPAPDAAGAVLVGTETGEVWQVSPEARWTLLVSGLPEVHALLPLA